MTTAFILGILAILVVIVVADLWDALEQDWNAEVDQGQCAGQCRHQPCPTPFQCHLGAKQ